MSGFQRAPASSGYTEDWYRAYCERTGIPYQAPDGKAAELPDGSKADKPNKYRNKPTTRNGRNFDSIHEADIGDELELELRAGKYRAISYQVPSLLPGGVKYIADFVTMNPDGTYTVIDAKSPITRKEKAYRIKMRLMKNVLGITIREM